MSAAEVGLSNLRESQAQDRELFRNIEHRLAELDKRSALIEKAMADDAKIAPDSRPARAAIIVAVIGLIGSVLTSLLALRK